MSFWTKEKHNFGLFFFCIQDLNLKRFFYFKISENIQAFLQIVPSGSVLFHLPMVMVRCCKKNVCIIWAKTCINSTFLLFLISEVMDCNPITKGLDTHLDTREMFPSYQHIEVSHCFLSLC